MPPAKKVTPQKAVKKAKKKIPGKRGVRKASSPPSNLSYGGRPWPKDKAVQLLTTQLSRVTTANAALKAELAVVRGQLQTAGQRIKSVKAEEVKRGKRVERLVADLARCQEQLGRGDHWTAPR